MNYIKLEGAHNFRDIGGYVTQDGRKIKDGLLYRSDQLSQLSENDLKVFDDLHIKTVIDYRSSKERENNIDVCKANILHLDPCASIAALSIQDLFGGPIDPNKIYELMIDQYRQFVTDSTCIQVYRQMLKIIGDKKNAPVLQHCRGGKDRTGYGIALVLLLLGVDEKTVMEDYLLTNQFYSNLAMNQAGLQIKDENLLKAIGYLCSAHECYLQASIDEIKKYGNVENYVILRVGMSQDEIDQLKRIYLE